MPTPRTDTSHGRRASFASIAAALAASILLLFLALPTGSLVVSGGAAGASGLLRDHELRRAIALSAGAATIATALVALLGTPLAWLLARRRFRGGALVEAVLDLPLLIPHPVAGLALLLLLARDAPLGGALFALGLRVIGTPVGIVAAMAFVAAPLFVSAAREAIARVDVRYEHVARTLGDNGWRAFRRVTLPLAGRGILAGAVVTWARAVSEFGAIVVVAYHPRVASVLAYDRFTSFGIAEALPVAAALVIVALVPLVVLRALRVERAA
ncbi:MAG TPA: ABC transporter permease [Gemmatimonadaceae bacterium]|nr:ABC transporter permease [Gemmatimonadaceae bacterium]